MKNFIYSDNIVNKAFETVCLNKFKQSGYVDMSKFVLLNDTKSTVQSMLINVNSQFNALFDQKQTFPTSTTIKEEWNKFLKTNPSAENRNLSTIEAYGIFYWVISAIKKKEDRIRILYELLDNETIDLRICDKCIFFDNSSVEMNIISSVSEANDFLSQVDKGVFYLGHSSANYMLQPSIYRSDSLIDNESKLYNEIQIMCPTEFEKCKSSFECLVKMQHYGLPTRLLDITSNPLVAIYFACENNHDIYGELVLLKCPEGLSYQYYNTDIVAVLSNLARTDETIKNDLANISSGMKYHNIDKSINIFLSTVQIEKPSITRDNLDCLLNNYMVYALKNNNRIVKQDGAFIICGLGKKENLDMYRYKRVSNDDMNCSKMVVVLIKNKKEILKSLDVFSINRATIFPEIDSVSEYLKMKYSRN